MEFQDYYETMGVKRDATQDEIKRAYRKLSRKYHPDVSQEDKAEAKFKAVGEAYAVLKDPEKRAAYDQLGKNWQAGQDFRPPPGWDEGFEFSGAGSGDGFAGYGGQGHEQFSDFFEQLFRQSQGQGPFAGGQGGQNLQPGGYDLGADPVSGDRGDAMGVHGCSCQVWGRSRPRRSWKPEHGDRNQGVRLAGSESLFTNNQTD